jgi:hypothetical protein
MIDELVGFAAAPIELEFSGTDRALINHTLQHWFAATGKRAVPELDAKIANFKIRMAHLALGVRFKYTTVGKNGRLLAEADGENAITLSQVKLGTLWFDGWKNLEYEIMCVVVD